MLTKRSLGHTSKYPKFAVALKERETETAITILQACIMGSRSHRAS